MLHSRLCSLFLFFTLTHVDLADAQDKPSHVSVKVDLVAYGESIPGLEFTSGSKKQTSTALAFCYSKTLKYRGPRIIEISQSIAAKKKYAADQEELADKSEPRLSLSPKYLPMLVTSPFYLPPPSKTPTAPTSSMMTHPNFPSGKSASTTTANTPSAYDVIKKKP